MVADSPGFRELWFRGQVYASGFECQGSRLLLVLRTVEVLSVL